MSERKAFKDYFDRDAAKMLAAQISSAQANFDSRKFVQLATRQLGSLEFAGRVSQFSNALAVTLPKNVPEALQTLTQSLPPALPNCESVTDGWLQWPIGQYIADHGLAHFDESMVAMIELTQRFSSEFAVRPFVERCPEETFARLLELTDHESPHVRRWCSEGTRPRLPWGKKLHDLARDPSPIWPILEALKDDPEPYVRRSVANNMNDIAKEHPAAVVQRCTRWQKKSNPRRDWVIKHGLRSLVKAGDPAALSLLGCAPPKKLTATITTRPKRATIGEKIELRTELSTTASKPQDLIIDYIVHFARPKTAKQRGAKRKNPSKVFKWTSTRLGARETLALSKQHSLKQTTIRTLHPGPHKIELQVNGKTVANTTFTLR